MLANTQMLIEKIQSLPPNQLAAVTDFVDLLRLKEQERSLLQHAAQASAPAFAAVWDNPDDDVYDACPIQCRLSV